MTEHPTRLVLLGHPVSHSLSPLFQNAALRSAGLNVTYDALDVLPESLAQAVRDMSRGNVAGNVTIPHKESIAQLCARRTALADRVGAVNTFWHEKGKLIGDNTDVAGARAAITAILDAPGAAHSRADRAPLRVAVLGAGGAAAAVMIALESFAPMTVTLWSRNAERARALAARLGSDATIALDATVAVSHADLVVNCTPIGLSDNNVPVAVDVLQPNARVLDLIPRQPETEWVRQCRAAGHVTDDGLRMLVEQGAAAFERWFDIVPDRASMWRSLKPKPELPTPGRTTPTSAL